MTLVFARRGAADLAPENSLAAIEGSLRAGVDGVEIEVRLSRDAELVVIRSASVPFGAEPKALVEELTLAELQTIDVSGGRNGFEGSRIPTLAQAVELLAGSDAHLVIDVKEDPQHSEGASPTAIAVAAIVGNRHLQERVTITSTNHVSMAALAVAHPELQIGLRHLVVMEEAASYAAAIGAISLHPIAVGAATGDVDGARDRGVTVCASTLVAEFWPVTEEEQLDQLFALGVDAVVTDSYQSALSRQSASA